MTQGSKPGIIDIHHHGLAPFYKEILDNLDVHYLGGGTRIPTWSPEISLDMMDKLGISTAMFFITGWGVYSTTITRRSNEYWAKLIQDYPGKFGAFASLHFPDVEGALKELEYSMDQLKFDGVGILTNVQGHYITDPEYGELLTELNRRKTVINFHACVPPWDHPGFPPQANPDNTLDVYRFVGRLIRGDFFDRYPDIRWIIPFNGIVIPTLGAKFTSQDEAKLAALKRQYYTLRGGPIPSILDFFEPTHVMWGTDFLIGTDIEARVADEAAGIKRLREYDGLDEKRRALIERENALELFPRLKG